ncbi:efflux RND transporter periplasmic adaptor subunit [Treponema sp.]|uniref:efflux RND transporter periplasmic adaptor subunit n=1 Tax=Treponema sp. TaxID=166 RepID=UPI00298E1411|nr:efflux RND transporter periplasmic adaptor subunit [Treponema sp.]
MNFKKTLILTAAVAATLSLVSCKGNKDEDKKKGDEAQETVYAVNTFKTKSGNLDNYLEFGGDVSSVSAIDVLPDTNGKITRTLVSVGDKVKKDDIIAYVDASRPGMNYAASPVKSPVSGTVTSFPYTVGATVAPSMSIAKISDTKDLQIKVNIPERFVSRIQLNQKAAITFDSYPSDVFNAIVYEVSPVLDSVSRTMAIKLKIVPEDPKVRVGMYARVKLITESMHDVIVLPSNAVVMREGKPYLFVVSDKKTESGKSTVDMVPVKLGISVDNNTEISEGVTAGVEVVVKGQTLLNQGDAVTVLAVVNEERK